MQMDICSHIGLLVNDVNGLNGFCVDTLESAYGVLGDFSIDKLEYGVTNYLNIQDDKEEGSGSGSIPPHDKCVCPSGDACEEAHQNAIPTGPPDKLFSECMTFSSSSKTLTSALKMEMNDCAEDITNGILTCNDDDSEFVNPDCSDSSSLPSPLKPISAMKGSREKHGLTRPETLTVKWAPDVYDPIPTSISHMATKTARKNTKKKPQNKQKNGNKSPRSKNKDKNKKQIRKQRDACLKPCEHREEVICYSDIQPSAMDFHVGIPDLFCGSSFVNRYGSSLHISSVAEAT